MARRHRSVCLFFASWAKTTKTAATAPTHTRTHTQTQERRADCKKEPKPPIKQNSAGKKCRPKLVFERMFQKEPKQSNSSLFSNSLALSIPVLNHYLPMPATRNRPGLAGRLRLFPELLAGDDPARPAHHRQPDHGRRPQHHGRFPRHPLTPQTPPNRSRRAHPRTVVSGSRLTGMIA